MDWSCCLQSSSMVTLDRAFYPGIDVQTKRGRTELNFWKSIISTTFLFAEYQPFGRQIVYSSSIES